MDRNVVFRTVLLVVSLMTGSDIAVAGSQSGKIVWLQTRASDDLIAVHLEGVHANKPSCATQDYWIVKNENSETGKRHYSTLLAAYMAGKSVEISGLNSCTRWGDGEDINQVRIYAQ